MKEHDRCEHCGGLVDYPGLFGCRRSVHPEATLSQSIVLTIERDIRCRRGLRQEFEQIDDETQQEIRIAWESSVKRLFHQRGVREL